MNWRNSVSWAEEVGEVNEVDETSQLQNFVAQNLITSNPKTSLFQQQVLGMQLGVRKENTYIVHINADIIFIVATLGHPAELAEMVAMGSAYNLKGAECLGVATKDSLVGIVADNGEVVVVDEFEHHIVIATLAMGSHFCQGGHLVGQHRAKTLTHGCVQFGKTVHQTCDCSYGMKYGWRESP